MRHSHPRISEGVVKIPTKSRICSVKLLRFKSCPARFSGKRGRVMPTFDFLSAQFFVIRRSPSGLRDGEGRHRPTFEFHCMKFFVIRRNLMISSRPQISDGFVKTLTKSKIYFVNLLLLKSRSTRFFVIPGTR
jgi:hypothetical protein